MKRYILYILCALLAVLCITGCETKEERAQRKKNEKQAAEQAVQYIDEKYGFTPKVLSSDSDRKSGGLGWYYIPSYMIKMVYKKREFMVFIDGEEVRDNYQHEEIRQALQTEINDRIPGVIELRLDGYQFFNRWASDYTDCFCSEYFDGTNLFEVLNDCRVRFEAYYVQGDFTDESLFTWLDNTDSETEEASNAFRGQFISLRSEDAFVPLSSYVARVTDFYGDRQEVRGRFAIYADSYRDTAGIYEQYDLKKYGDLYYLTYSSDYGYNQPDHDILSIRDGEPPSSSELNETVGSRYYIASEAFDLNIYEKTFVVFFYHASKIDVKDRSRDNYNLRNRTQLLRMRTNSDDRWDPDLWINLIGNYAVSGAWYPPDDYNICFISQRDKNK